MSGNRQLPEISETDAEGDLAALYADIRQKMGVPMVALFYRNLAAIPGALPWMWQIVRPLLAAGRLEAAAASLPACVDAPALPRLTISSPEAAQQVREIVQAYNRANPFNLTCASLLGAILQPGAEEPVLEAPRGGRLPHAVAHLPEMVPPDTFSDRLRTALAALETEDTAGDGIVPSLYRHLAHWPDILETAAKALAVRFADGAVQHAARAVAARSRAEAAVLLQGMALAPVPPALEAQRDDVVESVRKFSRRIPEMIVVGRLLADALEEETKK
jgi:hypothetical protein